jgi:hypothetical protein
MDSHPGYPLILMETSNGGIFFEPADRKVNLPASDDAGGE